MGNPEFIGRGTGDGGRGTRKARISKHGIRNEDNWHSSSCRNSSLIARRSAATPCFSARRSLRVRGSLAGGKCEIFGRRAPIFFSLGLAYGSISSKWTARRPYQPPRAETPVSPRRMSSQLRCAELPGRADHGDYTGCVAPRGNRVAKTNGTRNLSFSTRKQNIENGKLEYRSTESETSPECSKDEMTEN